MLILKRIYQCLAVIFVFWILYSTFFFGYKADKESADWGITGGKLIDKYEFKGSDFKKIICKKNKKNGIMFITPKISTGNGGKVVSFVDIYAKTSGYNTKIMWITQKEKSYKPDNTRTTFFLYVKGRYTFTVDEDIGKLKIGPEKAKKEASFIIKRVIIKKYVMK